MSACKFMSWFYVLFTLRILSSSFYPLLIQWEETTVRGRWWSNWCWQTVSAIWWMPWLLPHSDSYGLWTVVLVSCECTNYLLWISMMAFHSLSNYTIKYMYLHIFCSNSVMESSISGFQCSLTIYHRPITSQLHVQIYNFSHIIFS